METTSRFVLGRPLLNGCVLAFGLAASAHASVLPTPALSGATDFDGWDDLSGASYAGYGSYSTAGDAWPAPMDSLSAGSGDATLNKIAGDGYAASSSIYTAFNGGSFQVADTTPLANLTTLVFQLVQGEDNTVEPTLTINGNQTVALLGTAAGTSYSFGDIDTGEGTVSVQADTTLYQWDLASVTDPITEWAIDWTTVPHAQIYAMRVDQSDTAASLVPEPASLAGLLTLGLATLRRRRGW